MENFKVIEYHKVRDFSSKVSTTFEFVRQNFKSLSKSILVIAGPPVFMASVLLGSFRSEFMNFSSMTTAAALGNSPLAPSFMSPTFWLQIVLMMVFGVVALVMSFSTVYNYMILYNERKTNQIDVQDVWQRVRSSFWMYFGTIFLYYLLAIGVMLILVIPMVVLGKISTVLLGFGFIGIFCLLFYLFIGSSLVLAVRAFEDKGFFDALGRSFMLVQGKLWSTFGVLLVLSILGGIISYVFLIPSIAINAVNTLHSVETGTIEEPSSGWKTATVILFALYYMVQMLLYALPNIGIAFQYYNLVERKEAKGLLGSIDDLGQEQPARAQDEQF